MRSNPSSEPLPASGLRRPLIWLNLAPEHHVLEVASGSGGPARYLANQVSCHVTGIDANERRIGVAEFNDLRHSCATLLIAQGVHPRVAMEILRHSQISTTMNTYAHVLPRLQRDATTKIKELFDAADEEPPPDTVD